MHVSKNHIASAKYNEFDHQVDDWWQRYGGMEIAELKKMKAIEEENKRLKRIVSQKVVDIVCLKELLGENSDLSHAAGRSEASG